MSWQITKEIGGGFPGGEGDEKEKGRYCRVMKSVDMSEESEVERVLAVIGDDVLKHVATRVTIDGTAPDGSPVEVSFI